METEIIRYVGRNPKSMIRVFKDIVSKARAATFSSASCLGEKKVKIRIIVEEM